MRTRPVAAGSGQADRVEKLASLLECSLRIRSSGGLLTHMAMDWTKLIEDEDGGWVLCEADSDYGLEVYLRGAGDVPSRPLLDFAEAASRQAGKLSQTALAYLDAEHAAHQYGVATADFQLVWLEVAEGSAPGTCRFTLVFCPESDRYYLFSVVFASAARDIPDARPHAWSFRAW